MTRLAGVFVAGTDTEVGKTVVSAALVAALRDRGVDAGYIKPVGSDGVEEDGRLVSPDLVFVRHAAGITDPTLVANPVCLRAPLAPLAAARLEGVTIDPDQVIGQVRAAGQGRQFLIVEGVGGVMVPLAEGYLALDLMADLGLPVVVAARPGLGTINHSLLTIAAARGRGLTVAGFVFSEPDPALPPDPAIAQNASLIAEFSDAPFLGRLAWLPRDREGLVAPGDLLAATKGLDLGPLLALVHPRQG